MISVLAASLLAQTSASAVLDRAAGAHAALRSGDVKIVSRATGPTGTAVVDARVRFVQPRQLWVERTERGIRRIFFLDNRAFSAYDPAANERLTRVAPAESTLLGRMEGVTGPLEPPIRLIANPKVSQETFGSLRAVPWKISRQGDVTRLVGARDGGSVEMAFRSDLLTSFRLRNPDGSRLEWQFTYGKPPARIVYGPPTDARLVANFTELPDPPTYANYEARRVSQLLLRSTSRYTKGQIVISDETGTRRIAMNEGRYLQTGGTTSWAFDGTQLMVRGPRAFYRGPSRRSEIVERLGTSGVPPEAWLRAVLTRTPLFPDFAPGARVSVKGSAAMDGVDCTILELTRSGLRLTIFVRRDGLPASIGTETLDTRGNVVTRSNRRYRYSAAPPPADFVIRPAPGQKVQPFQFPPRL